MTEQQFYDIVDAFSDFCFAYENKHAQYDHFASTSAAANFRKYARYVDFKGDLDTYFTELTPIISQIRKNLPDAYRGEYSGGSATLGSCLERFKEHFEDNPSYTPEQHKRHFELKVSRFKERSPLPSIRLESSTETYEERVKFTFIDWLLFLCLISLLFVAII